jgi:hypothetical protein
VKILTTARRWSAEISGIRSQIHVLISGKRVIGASRELRALHQCEHMMPMLAETSHCP